MFKNAKRLSLYKNVAEFVRAFANLANELQDAGYTDDEVTALKAEVGQFEKVREEVKLAGGNYIDLKMYEPAMRHLIDNYIRAEDGEKTPLLTIFQWILGVQLSDQYVEVNYFRVARRSRKIGTQRVILPHFADATA